MCIKHPTMSKWKLTFECWDTVSFKRICSTTSNIDLDLKVWIYVLVLHPVVYESLAIAPWTHHKPDHIKSFLSYGQFDVYFVQNPYCVTLLGPNGGPRVCFVTWNWQHSLILFLKDIFSQFLFIILEVTLFWLEPKFIFLWKLAITVFTPKKNWSMQC